MTKPTDNLGLELLRAIRGDIAELRADVLEIKVRVGFLEQQYANLSGRVDRISGDVLEIRQRLKFVDA